MKNNCGIEKVDIDEIVFFLNKNFRNKFLRIKENHSFFDDDENP